MEATCHECGNVLVIETAELDGCNDMEIEVGLCTDCYDAVGEESSGWEDRARSAEVDLEHAQDQLECAQEELAEAEREIAELKRQIDLAELRRQGEVGPC
jgi:chromosome segregation ATPase